MLLNGIPLKLVAEALVEGSSYSFFEAMRPNAAWHESLGKFFVGDHREATEPEERA